MALNLNERVKVLDAVALTDVAVTGGTIYINGADSINKYKVQGLPQYIGTSDGIPGFYNITSTAGVSTFTGDTTYSGVIQQVLSGKTYTFPFSYTTPTLAPGALAFYTALAAAIQPGIDGGAIFGTLSPQATGLEFTGTAAAPVIAFASSNLTSTQTPKTLTVTGFDNAGIGVSRAITCAAGHGLTIGQVYNVTIAGLTGTSAGPASINGRTFPCIPTSSTLISVIGTSNTGAVTITTATFTVNNDAVQTFYAEAGRMTGYDPTKSYVGILVAQVSEADVESGVVIPQLLLVNADPAVNATIAVLGGYFAAINAGLA
jgi:hypothetical protein